MPARVLFIGDINVDILMGGLASPPMLDCEITCESYQLTMGSSGVICACAYSSLGGSASYLGLAGQDDYGEFMAQGLREFGVNTDLIVWTDTCKTGVTVNLVYGNTRSQVTYPGTIAQFDGSGIDENVLSQFNHVHLSGPYQQTRFRPRITKVLRLAREQELSTSLDPQWDASEEWEFMEEWLPLLTFLFLNEGEARSMTGQSSSGRDALASLRQRTNCPILKVGASGVVVMEDRRIHRIPAQTVKVVDTVGAGDAFDAAFLFGRLEKRMDLLGSARFANAAAARSCTSAGGVAARSSFQDVLNFMRASAG